MTEEQKLIMEINHKYAEWFELAGEESPALMIKILASLVIKERNKNIYYKGVYRNGRLNSTFP